MSRQETESKIRKVMSRMEELQISRQRKFDELSEHQSKILEAIIQKLTAYFKSDNTAEKFCKWYPSEAPKAKTTWQETKNEVLKSISERTRQFIQNWEDEEHEFARAQVSLIKYCFDKYNVMEEEILQAEEEVFFDDTETPKHDEVTTTKTKCKSRARTRRNTADTAPVWFQQGLASVVVGSPLRGSFGSKHKKLHYKAKLERYADDPCDYMSKRSRKCLKMIATQDRLLPFINKQLEPAVRFLKQMKEKIPKLLEGDEQLYQQLLDDDRSKTQVQELYGTLDKQLEYLTRELTVYNLREIRKSDFTNDELKWERSYKSVISSGSFSTVYKGKLTRKGEPEIEVALKVYKDLLTTNNVWYFVDEERALRFVFRSSQSKMQIMKL